MKKLFFFLMVTLFFIAGCSTEYKYDLEIRNDSSFDLEFTVNNNETIYKVNSKETLTITDTNPDKNITLINNPRVDMDKSFRYCIFTDMEYKEINVLNTLSLDITLCEENGFIGQTYGETVSVEANSTKSFLLYTDKPNYSAYTIIDNKKTVVDISNLIFY